MNLSLKVFIATSLLVACGPVPDPLNTQPPTSSVSATTALPPETKFDDSPGTPSAGEPRGVSDPLANSDTVSTAPPLASSAGPNESPLSSALVPIDVSVSDTTTFNGKVFDLNNDPLDGVKITVTSLSAEHPYSVETSTVGSTYAFNNAPAGVQLQITASKAGFAPRTRIEVLKSNKSGDPDANRYDFGTDGQSPFGTPENALSDSPEVIAVTPGHNTSNQSPTTSFTLSFSEPMNQKSVEDSFSIRAFNTVKFSVDAGATDDTFMGDSNLDTITNPLIWDKDAFDINWNGSSTEVNFSFKAGRFLPTDKDEARLPEYQVVFNTSKGQKIMDSSGSSRDKLFFRLSAAAPEESYRFGVKSDTQSPQVVSISAKTQENGSVRGDAIQVNFSETMILYTLTHKLSGGLEDRSNVPGSERKAPAPHPDSEGNVTASSVARNYQVLIDRANQRLFSGNWADLGGTVSYNSADDSYRSVWLLPPLQGTLSSNVAGAPVNDETVSITALLEDGSSKPLITRTYQTQSAWVAEHVATAADITTSHTESLSVFYADGSSEVNINLSNPATNTYAALKNALGELTSNGAADWTVTEVQSGGGSGNGNVDANDRLNITLAPNAMRNGKTIAHVTLNGGIFASGTLNMGNYKVVTSPLNETQGTINSGFDLTGGRFSISEVDAAGGAGVWAAGDTLSLELTPPMSSQSKISKVIIAPSGIFAASRLNAPAAGFVISPNTIVGGKVDVFQPGDTISVIVNTTVTDPAGNTMDTSKNNAVVSAS